MKHPIEYRIIPSDPAAHLFSITLTVHTPDPLGQTFMLPAWIPGSYMIREFARNIVSIHAQCNGKNILLTKQNKDTWHAAPCTGPLILKYDVYAWDLSVRTAHLDQTHGFFNGTSVFLRVVGQEHQPHLVQIQRPKGSAYQRWNVATSLPEWHTKRYDFGSYSACNYDDLIDHPVEMGTFQCITFHAHGIPHDIILTGRIPNLDTRRLRTDVQALCEAHIALFEPATRQAPMSRYVFLIMVVDEGYGGLEHRASTALICARKNFPVKNNPTTPEGYQTLLGLCSHEYFHTWNVKRIKPAAFVLYDLHTENYTSLLWLFEGFTSYYDDLMLLRSGRIDEPTYFKKIVEALNTVLKGSGRTKQSIAESSFDAWGKYYRQDENAPNAIVSYYTKGALVALALDLTIRHHTAHKKSLDDVMRTLWQEYGRDFYTTDTPKGIEEHEILPLLNRITGCHLNDFFQRYITGTEDPPLAELFKPLGITLSPAITPTSPKVNLGIRIKNDHGNAHCATVHEHSVAHQAGMSAGDILIAIDDLRVSFNNYESLLSRYRIGDTLKIHVFRRDELMCLSVHLTQSVMPKMTLSRVT